MALLLCALISHAVPSLDQGDEMSGPPEWLVSIRTTLLRQGMSQEQTSAILGLRQTRPLYISGTINSSRIVYPLKPNHRITINYRLDVKCREISHVLDDCSID